jgi:2,3,4,5-tetrahydropyridine-2-carboxylate N-succinyltransferase
MSNELQTVIDEAWEKRDGISSATKGAVRDAVESAIAGLDDGTYRTAEKFGDEWVVNQWLKKAVLLSFRLYDSVPMDGINLGAYVDTGTMVDTWATVGSCAQIGKNCHLSGGVGIGGVLEPLQANPVIVEDNCFIGARSEVVEGVIVGTGSVLSMGVFISANTRIVDRETGQIHVGKVPPYSVVHPGTMGGSADRPARYCVIITKTVDERTRSKTSINELLRD